MEVKLQDHYMNLVETLSDILTYRNIESIEHMKNVQGYTWILVNQYAKLYPEAGMTERKIEMISEAALIHDVGKIVMPDSLLNRAGRLSKTDMELAMEHTVEGEKIVKRMFAFLGEDYCEACSNICLYHHEKYDGSGYPNGLKGKEIPIEAQIVALADIYDILIHTDAHKKIISKEKAYYMLMNDVCGKLSAEMKECLESAKEALEAFSLEDQGEKLL